MKRSPLLIILLVAFVDLAGFGLIIPLQGVYAERLGASGTTLGLLVGIYALMQLVFTPLLGRWSDHVGRRRVLLISVGGSVCAHVLLGVADLAHSLPLLFVARTLDGITGANISTAQAYIGDVTSAQDRAKGMGLFGAAFGVGFVIGPAMGAILASLGSSAMGEAGTSWPAFGAAALSLGSFFLVWRLLPESRPAAAPADPDRPVARHAVRVRHFRKVFGEPRLRELLMLLFSATFAFVLLELAFILLCTKRFDLDFLGTGLVFTYFGILMVIIQGGLVGRLAKRYGESRLIATGPFITTFGFLMLSGAAVISNPTTGWVLLIVGSLPIAFGQGITGPNLNAMLSRHAGRYHQGGVLGVSQSIVALARAIAPLLAGRLYDLGPAWPFRVGAVIFVGVGLGALAVLPAQEAALRRSADVGASNESSH